MAAKRKKRGSRFALGLKVFFSVLTVFAIAALAVLWVFLARYQDGIDEENEARRLREEQAAYELAVVRAPQLAFEDFVSKADGALWAEQWFSAHPESLDVPEKVADYMHELFDPQMLQYWKAPDYVNSSPRYLIQRDGQDLAFVTLAGSGLDWSVSRIDLLVTGEQSASLLVPEGYAVSCNGHPLDESYRTQETRFYDMEMYADRMVDPVHWDTFTVSGQLFEPVLTAEAPAGRPTVTDADGNTFYILPADEAQPLRQRAENFTYALLYYYMLGNGDTASHMWNALNHVAEGSQAFKVIRDSYDGFTWAPSYNIGLSCSASAGEVRVLAANCVVVDVLYHAEGICRSDGVDYPSSIDGTYRIYFLDLGGGFSIYGLAYA